MSSPPDRFIRLDGRIDVGLLASTLVVVVGVGTVGSQLARELANCAVGHLRLIDGDRLEEHNVPRHALNAGYVGWNKAEGLKDLLEQDATTIKVDAVARYINRRLSNSQLDKLLDSADLIVVATDDRSAQRRVGRRALSLDIPAIFPALYADGGGENFVQLGPGAPCFFCWDGFRDNNEQLRGVQSLNAEGFAVLQHAVELCMGVLDTKSSFARMLVGPPNDRRPRQLFIQEPRAALRMVPVPYRPDCPSCEVGPPSAGTTSPQAPSAPAGATSQPANRSPAASTETASTSQQTLIESARQVLAIALGAGALVWPFLWLSLAILAAFAVICARDVRIRGIELGPADLIVIPLRFVGNGARWLARQIVTIAPVAVAIVWICWWGVVAAAIPFVIGGAIWLASHGVDGLLAAARLAAEGHGFRVFAFITCYRCLQWTMSQRPVANAVRARARTLSEPTIATAAGMALVWLVLCGFVLPRHTWAPEPGLKELVSHLPAGIQDPISDGRAALAEYEARAVVRCMADHDRSGWRTPRATVHPDGSIIVTVAVSASRPPGDRSIAVLMLALENQLARHADRIAIGEVIQYAPRAVSSPVDDVADVAQNVTDAAIARAVARISLTEGDAKVALRCSAVAI